MALVLLGGLTYKLIEFLKFLRAGDKNAILTQLTSWVVGVGLVFLFAQASIADGLKLGSFVVTGLDATSKIILGLSLTSLVGAAYDGRRAIDNTDSAKSPELFPDSKS